MVKYAPPYPKTSHATLLTARDRLIGTPSYQFGFESDDIPILASRSGKVVDVKYRKLRTLSFLSHSSKEVFEKAHSINFVVVQHEDGTFGRYIHLRSDLSIGTEINTGDLLGSLYGGLPGTWSHIHFSVYRMSGDQRIWIPVDFSR